MQPVFEESGTPVRDEFILFDKFLLAPVTQRDEKAKRWSLRISKGESEVKKTAH